MDASLILMKHSVLKLELQSRSGMKQQVGTNNYFNLDSLSKFSFHTVVTSLLGGNLN